MTLLPSPRGLLAAGALVATPALAQDSFVNWETPHVSPLALSRDGSLLAAVNTADARLEIWNASGEALVHRGSVPVGIDPVSVRLRSDTEAWVVNHVSDSISIVDLRRGHVVATLQTDDEPCDVVFAGEPQRAYVSCSQANTVLVFDPASPGAAPERIEIGAEDPRAMAVSPDGTEVYVAIFESGNGSTILGGGKKGNDILDFPPNAVNKAAGPYGGVNPPPNAGEDFDPPLNPANPTPLKVGLIVKKDAEGAWRDDNGTDWTELVSGPLSDLSGRPVGWDLVDRDVAVIDTADLGVSYVEGLMNLNMAIATHPVSGALTVVGTDATNEIRFEPKLNGRFLQVVAGLVDLEQGTSEVVDLNPHLGYGKPTIRQEERDRALGDPRGVVWNPTGTRAYVTGMGSNNLVVIDARGDRAGTTPTIEVGEGPTGIALDAARGRLYVLNKFDASISTVSTATEREVARTPFFDPSPEAVKVGRKHLYGTHENSGLGQISCASCHVDARMDRLAWDLGDPAGEMKAVDEQNKGAGINLLSPPIAKPFEDWHPMKGPMLTQTMQDIIGKEPHHWRGDRDGLEEFAPAFEGLQGDDETLTEEEMQEFEDFLATIYFPPNPNRDFDNSLPTDLALDGHYRTGRFGGAGEPLPNGDATNGLELYQLPNKLDRGVFSCTTCHTLPIGIGTDNRWQSGTYEPLEAGPKGERHHALVSEDGSTNLSIKVAQLRNLHERTGFNMTQTESRAGFGYLHDGSIPSLERFVALTAFDVENDQEVADLVAFLLSFAGSDLPLAPGTKQLEPPGTLSQDTHAAVGAQLTMNSPAVTEGESQWLAQVVPMADAGAVGLIAKRAVPKGTRGYVYRSDDTWQSDVAGETVTTAQLMAGARGGRELTFTVVPAGTEDRMGIDRDADGILDGDEAGAGSLERPLRTAVSTR